MLLIRSCFIPRWREQSLFDAPKSDFDLQKYYLCFEFKNSNWMTRTGKILSLSLSFFDAITFGKEQITSHSLCLFFFAFNFLSFISNTFPSLLLGPEARRMPLRSIRIRPVRLRPSPTPALVWWKDRAPSLFQNRGPFSFYFLYHNNHSSPICHRAYTNTSHTRFHTHKPSNKTLSSFLSQRNGQLLQQQHQGRKWCSSNRRRHASGHTRHEPDQDSTKRQQRSPQ